MHDGRLLKLAICSTLFNKGPEWNIDGTSDELQALSTAMRATQHFTNTLNSEGASAADAMRALKEKHSAARRFEAIYGIRWPV
jgi:hypothetical protein